MSSTGKHLVRVAVHTAVLGWAVLGWFASSSNLAHAQEEYFIELSSGMRIGPGVPSETDSISTNAFQRGGTGEVQGKSIGILDDGLRLTFYNASPRNVLRVEESNAPPFEQIDFPSAPEAARSGNPPSIQGIMGISKFNRYGRRTFSFLTTRGRVDVLQGITLLTPTFAKVEILRTKTDKFVWDSRIATSSIPAQKLREILDQTLDLSNSNDWLRMVSFYMQAERFGEAHSAMSEALLRFPELRDRQSILGQLDQLRANQIFEEIKLRRQAGQHKLATRYLGTFPVQVLPLETQLKIDADLKELQRRLTLIGEISESLKAHVDQLPEPDMQVVKPIVDELLSEISMETDARLDDYQRFRLDEQTPVENKVALAVSGWMLGPSAGLDNFAVVKSLLRVRGMVKEYLDEAPPARRQQILTQLKGEEGAQPQLLDLILEYMKPPQTVPEPNADDPPGLHRLTHQTRNGTQVDYVVQLPPEYDPNRKYPCVLALPGRGELPESEVNWWCGQSMQSQFGPVRFGQATRYGYIVISPAWMTETQAEYQYTEKEHERILGTLRHAQRRFSVDTDRVFVSGHYDGATAAWDLAVAHPDLWAGAIMVSPGASKYIVNYVENVQGKTPDQIPLGTYIVYGDSDGTRNVSKLGTVATRYLTSPTYDSLVVEYRGRGREKFLSELPRIMEWMQLSSHRRVRTPRTIEARTMRPGDRFFYWLEAPSVLPKAAGSPFLYNPANSATFEANLLDPAINGVNISRIASENKSAIVWLTPDMVDFNRPILVKIGKANRFNLSPDIGVMLEDARQRADRMHVYWQRVQVR